MKKYKFTINEVDYSVQINNVEDRTMEVEVNGALYTVLLDKEVKQTKTPLLLRPIAIPSTDQGAAIKTDAKTGIIRAPLPGTILDILVKPGDSVSIGQRILSLEAMKMENTIEADRCGTVIEVKVAKGDSVLEGVPLVTIG
ncbi:MAG: acetyl-CoA carboxylase biotin carboxyl carrier protein subunit [Bacteroidales bacterium]|nr:acetyl-CoA carboxylase biotin carboxyl carrier protein subunit [Bacteroidales bacterium]